MFALTGFFITKNKRARMSKRLIIERFCESISVGTFGKVFLDGNPIGYSVEQPWQGNEPFKSCIPAGDYEIVDFNSPKYGQTIALKNLSLGVGVFPGEARRYACLIHPANVAKELQGCIALGKGLGFMSNRWAVTDSSVLTRTTIKAISPAISPGSIVSIIWKDHP